MLKYDEVLLDCINREKAGIDYFYSESDAKVLHELLLEINKYAGTKFRFLAELDAFDIKGAGEIIARYVTKITSESVRAFLIPQMVSDRIKNCDKIILDLYMNFKSSDEYIDILKKTTPAHIYVRYDNAFKTLKPKKLKGDLIQLVRNPIDAFYLPFTIRMLASWKAPELKSLLISYLDGTVEITENIGINNKDIESCDLIANIKRELKFTAIDCLKNYLSDEIVPIIRQYEFDDDLDFRMAAKKTLKKYQLWKSNMIDEN